MLEMTLVILLSIGAVIFAAIGMGRTHHSIYNSKHVTEEYRELMKKIEITADKDVNIPRSGEKNLWTQPAYNFPEGNGNNGRKHKDYTEK